MTSNNWTWNSGFLPTCVESSTSSLFMSKEMPCNDLTVNTVLCQTRNDIHSPLIRCVHYLAYIHHAFYELFSVHTKFSSAWPTCQQLFEADQDFLCVSADKIFCRSDLLANVIVGGQIGLPTSADSEQTHKKRRNS